MTMKRNLTKITAVFLVVLMTLSWQVANASILSVAEKAVQEILELAGEKLGREGAEEITEKIGREGLETLMEKGVREGGDELVEKIVRYGGSYGESALRAIRRSPAAITRCLEDLGAGQMKTAINALNRNPEIFTGIVEKYGAKALETEIRHPGVGGKLVSLFGEDAIELGRHLTTDQMIRFARYSDDAAKLGQKQSRKLLEMLYKAPGKVLDALESHPRTLTALTALGIAVPVGSKLVEGTREIHQPDGTEIRTAGPLSKMFGDAGKSLGNGLMWGVIMLFAVLAMIMLLRSLPRNNRRRETKVTDAKPNPAPEATVSGPPGDTLTMH